MNLEQLREAIRALQSRLQALAGNIATMASNTETPIDDLRASQTELAEGRERLSALREQEATLMAQSAAGANPTLTSPGQHMDARQARGAFYRAALTGGMQRLPRAVHEHLGAIPAEDPDQGHGSRLSPTTMADYLLTEPVDVNPIREIMRVTTIPGLVVPRIAFELEDDAFVSDKALAKELKAEAGESVVFGRFKSKVIAKVSETVINRSNYDVEGEVTGAIRTQLGLRELRRMTNKSPSTDEAHMSLYSTKNAIAEVSGPTLFDAIRKSYASLHELFRARAIVVMRFIDYIDMLDDLRTVNPAFFAQSPEAVLGVPKVVFCDSFEQPVIGDYQYLQLNYDGPGTYDTDKDITKGVHRFVETDWLDIHVLLKSAFRRAKVTEVP